MRERHLLALSGGKDSAALAVYMREKYPNLPLEYVFIDSGCELPETYAYLDRLRAMLGIRVTTLRSRRDFSYWLKMFGGVLPSPKNRWCTRELKLKPFAAWLRDVCSHSRVFNYVGLRSDEDRTGYKPRQAGVASLFPFVTDSITYNDVERILRDSGLGFPEYYSWRQRSGCYFCFYQKDAEWRGLRHHHPDLFERACAIEEQHADGRRFTWRDSGYLRDLSLVSEFTTRVMEGRMTSLLDSVSACLVEADQRLLLRCHGGDNE